MSNLVPMMDIKLVLICSPCMRTFISRPLLQNKQNSTHEFRLQLVFLISRVATSKRRKPRPNSTVRILKVGFYMTQV